MGALMVAEELLLQVLLDTPFLLHFENCGETNVYVCKFCKEYRAWDEPDHTTDCWWVAARAAMSINL